MSKLDYAFRLPIRPPLQQYESFTSYCIRLAEANLIKSTHAFSKLLFPFTTNTFSGSHPLTDLPPISFGLLPQAVNRSEEELRLTTFSHLLRLFGRTQSPQQARRFFGDAISDTLRYCPLCLMERRRYFLHWNFHYLQGCPRHVCALQDHCPHCKTHINPWKSTLRLSICNNCNGLLTKTTPTKLHKELHEQVVQQWKDLTLLLYPIEINTEGDASAEALRTILVDMREDEVLTMNEAANRAKINYTSVIGLEKGLKGTKYGFSFSESLIYIRSFDTTIEQVVNRMPSVILSKGNPSRRTESTREHKTLQLITQTEKELLRLCKEGVEKLQISGLSVNPNAVCSLLRVAPITLKAYPVVWKFLKDSRQERWDIALKHLNADEVDEIYKKRVLSAIEVIKSQGNGLREGVVYQIAGIAKTTLQGRPWIETLIKAEVLEHYRFEAKIRQNEIETRSGNLVNESTNQPSSKNSSKTTEQRMALTSRSREFEERYWTSIDPEEAVRLHILWLASMGMSRQHIAYVTGVSISTVRSTCLEYNPDQTETTLQQERTTSKPMPVLNAEQKQELRELLREAVEHGEPWDGVAVSEWISRRVNKPILPETARRYYIELSPVPILVKPKKRS